MNRRDALKTLATIAMTPMVKLRAGIDREALMLPFCGESSRYTLHVPFQQGSLTYATDSWRIVRAELTAPEIVGEKRLPPAAKLFEDSWHPRQWIEMPRPEVKELVISNGDDPFGICPVCLGREISFGENYPDREVLEDLMRRGIRWDVDENAHGDESCPQCRGREYYGPSVVVIGEERCSFAMMAPIWNLPGILRVSVNQKRGAPLLFTADGFEGMVMPLAEI